MENPPKMSHLRVYTPIKLTYVCKLFNKNLFCNIGYLVNDLTKYKKFTTFNMFKYTYNRLPY
jgi:hypothetical protein